MSGASEPFHILSFLFVIFWKEMRTHSYPDGVVVIGGSHGGFLAAHMLSRPEFAFVRAIAMRNPVGSSPCFFSDFSNLSFKCSCFGLEFSHDRYSRMVNKKKQKKLIF